MKKSSICLKEDRLFEAKKRGWAITLNSEKLRPKYLVTIYTNDFNFMSYK